MNLITTIKNFFKRGQYIMTVDNLDSILEHPKISVSTREYERIQQNLVYYRSEWGKQSFFNTNGLKKERDKNHLPIARTAAKKIASLVYNEQAEIIVEGISNDFVQEQLKNDRFNKNFERYLESCLALGGLAMRPYVDGDKIRVAFIQAPVFLPLQSNTQDVSSAAIVMKTTKVENRKNIYYTLIEFHEWSERNYTVSNELYRSEDDNKIGRRVPITELYGDLVERIDFYNTLSRPLFTYLKPPGMNNKDINSPLGLSIFDNAKATIDFINTTYDEFQWEIKMGQRRVAVPEQTVKTKFIKDGDLEFVSKEFDPEQNVFVQIGSGADDPIKVTDLTTPIRADDYIKAINEGLRLFEMQIGVSAGLFTYDGKSMKTATEVVSENSDTYQMRNSIVSLVEQSIKELIVSICELGKFYKLYSGDIPTFEQITINLDDGVFTDKNVELDYWLKAKAGGLVSQVYAIQKALRVDETTAQEMANAINFETANEISQTRSNEDVGIYGE